MAYNLVVCGGTFDHFHQGHRTLLKQAFSLGKKILIGVTSDNYVRKLKFKTLNFEQIESFEKREKSVLYFINEEKVSKKTEVIKIDDLFGSTLSKDLLIDVIVVSGNTKKGAEIINQKRSELGLSCLKIFVSPFVKAEDGEIISSEKIRNGEINREGKLYVKKMWLEKDLVLPEELKAEFKKPFGEIIRNVERNINNPYVISVGDATTKRFNENSISQNISVVDFKIARKEIFSSFSELGFFNDIKTIVIDNPAGHIAHDLFLKILNIFKLEINNKIVLRIMGEEDLVVLPLILVAPLGTVIYYGQPGVGLVKVVVSERIKEKAHNLALKFRPIESHTRGY
jgi:pantetheine-phosphate adenylyltransferase